MSAIDGGQEAECDRPDSVSVLEDTERLARQLLDQHERLRAAAASLEDERTPLGGATALLRSMDEERRVALEILASVDRDRGWVQRQLETLRRELADAQERGQQCSRQYLQIERQNSNLANLYVAAHRLHGSVERNEVLEGLQEILANLVGTEQIAVFEKADGGRRLVPVWVSGIDPDRYRWIEIGRGPIGRSAASGEIFLAGPGGDTERPTEDPDLTACIPLKLADGVIGAIAVFQLLPQKRRLEDVDRELFDLLATHAATALYCTKLHARVGGTEART